MKSAYAEIFKQRGLAYDTAMQRYPKARDEEFHALFTSFDTNTIKTVADVPSGGGYLKKFFPHCDIDYLEPCDEFKTYSAHGEEVDLENIQFKKDKYDLIVCLAAVHHIQNKQGLFNASAKALNKGGYLCIGDVIIDCDISIFLDGFTGRYNGTGHSGNYLREQAIHEYAEKSNLNIVELKEKECPWHFATEKELVDFCFLLFGLRDVDYDTVLEALNHYVGISTTENGVQLDWKLLYITLKKP